ncbi:MAG: alpha/beta hydrolase-fold protein [Acidobacteriota bacterium]|nr:alpha/beta hydrolase-fold protein [Acidobacteriota bacterium]
MTWRGEHRARRHVRRRRCPRAQRQCSAARRRNQRFCQDLSPPWRLPWVRRPYNVTRDPTRVVVGGSSYGGLASPWLAFRHSEIVGNVLSQSGSYWWHRASASPTRTLRSRGSG